MIQITHFVNPHMFFFKREAPEGVDKPLHEMEMKIYGTVGKKMQLAGEKEEIKIGDIVAALVPWNKWIRAQVKEKHKNGFYCVWAVDYGVPMMSKPSEVIKLPPIYTKMNMKNPLIHLGGLRNCIPAETNYDLEKNDNVLMEISKWSGKSMEISEKLISNAIQLRFEDVVELKSMTRPHSFGTLKVQKPDGSWADLNQCLSTALVAKISNDNWNAQVQRFDSIRQDEWKTTDGKYLHLNFVVLPMSPKKLANEIAANQSDITPPVIPQSENKESINNQPISSQSENKQPVSSQSEKKQPISSQSENKQPVSSQSEKKQPVNIHPENNNGQNHVNESSQTNDTVSPNGLSKTRPSMKQDTTMKNNRNRNNLPNRNPRSNSQNPYHQRSNFNRRYDHESRYPHGWHPNGKLNNQRFREEMEYFEASFRKQNSPVKQEDSSSEDSLVTDAPNENKTTDNETTKNGTNGPSEKHSGEIKPN